MQSPVEEVQCLVATEQSRAAPVQRLKSPEGCQQEGVRRATPLVRRASVPGEDAGDPGRSGLDGELGDEGVEEVRGGGAGGGELSFQRVHQGHQLVHLRHNPLLLGKRGEWENQI